MEIRKRLLFGRRRWSLQPEHWQAYDEAPFASTQEHHAIYRPWNLITPLCLYPLQSTTHATGAPNWQIKRECLLPVTFWSVQKFRKRYVCERTVTINTLWGLLEIWQSNVSVVRSACTAPAIWKARSACAPLSGHTWWGAQILASVSLTGGPLPAVSKVLCVPGLRLWLRWMYLTLCSSPPQENTVTRVQQAQATATTWPPAIVPAGHSARLTTPARSSLHQWMAAVAMRELTWTKTTNVFAARSALAITKTTSLRLERLYTRMATHGICTADTYILGFHGLGISVRAWYSWLNLTFKSTAYTLTSVNDISIVLASNRIIMLPLLLKWNGKTTTDRIVPFFRKDQKRTVR